jgi:hypothetical protein
VTHLPLELTDGVAASDLACDTDELVPTAKPKGIYGRGYSKPKPGLRQLRPTSEKPSGESWWVKADRESFTAAAERRYAQPVSKDFVFYRGMGDPR